ncbi:LuxR C-terminal-related transcriptional regulator [Hoeflea sp. TYP-13]|uniref:helix-turn-helix transcriptional regulator n=1 Tax=Hoeflea sp. TYP-13 TaxID=3230023 RepID=UPI0034C6573E
MQKHLDAISGLQTSDEVDHYLSKVGSLFGFDFYSIVSLALGVETRLTCAILTSNWPGELIASYEQHNIRHSSPVFSALQNSAVPLMALATEAPADPDAKPGIPGELDKVRTSVFFPFLDPEDKRHVVAFHGNTEFPEHEALLELHRLAAGLFEKFCSLRVREENDSPVLSARELECLRWTAAGKTSHEIALILSISEHTVNHYMSSICQKLDTVNRIQAVARAIRTGLIA